MLPSGEQFELRHDDQLAVAVEVGGGLRAYTVGGRDVLLSYGEGEMCSGGKGQVLAPWPNRLAEGRYSWEGTELQLPLTEVESGSAIHGLVRWAPWRAVERAEDAVTLEHVLHPQPGYPFSLRLTVGYALSDDGLACVTAAENVGREACPFGLGHHPYLAGDVDAMTVELPGDEPIRVGERRLDETRRLSGPASSASAGRRSGSTRASAGCSSSPATSRRSGGAASPSSR